MHRSFGPAYGLATLLLASLACGGSSSGARPDRTERSASLIAAPVFAACGTPSIDGILAPGEWDGAVKVRFAAALPELTDGPGAFVPAEVQAMSDDANLYVAFRLEANLARFAQSHAVAIDSNEDGQVSAGDDDLVYSWAPGGGSPLFFDDHRWSCVVDGAPAVCGTLDEDPADTAVPVGTTDGGAAISFTEDSTTIELWHPYAGSDPRDVRRTPGQSVPMSFAVRLLTVCDVDVNDWPAAAHCFGDTYFPPSSDSSLYRTFTLGCGGTPPEQQVVEVHIEVKPGDLLPTIQLGSEGSTPVAVLGSEAFDVARVDPGSLWFAGAAVERDAAGAPRVGTDDVDGDGRDDLVAHFATADLQLDPGSLEATLAGETVDGARFHGTDAVRVIAP